MQQIEPHFKTLLEEVSNGWKTGIPRHRVTLPGGTTVYKADLKPLMKKLRPEYAQEVEAMKEASHFILRKGQKIGLHPHKEDMEIWVFVWDDDEGHRHTEVSFCPPGGEHEWPNDKEAIVHVFALKWWASIRKDA